MNSCHYWDAYSHRVLYERIHGNGFLILPDGAGVSGASSAQDGWAELATVMANARDRTEAALRNAGAVWEGDAADSMQSGVTPLAQWAADANTAGTASQSSTDTHVNAYSTAKNQMPEPVKVTSTANTDFAGIPAGFSHLLGGQTDQDRQEAAAQEAKEEAVRVMQDYDSESGIARVSVGEFVPPPSVTVTVPPPQPQGGDIPQPGESGDVPGGDGTRSAGDTGGGRGTGGDTSTLPPGTSPPPPGTTTPSSTTPTPTRAPADPGPRLDPGTRPDPHRPGLPLAPVGAGRTPGGSGGQPSGGRGPGSGGPASGGRGPGSGVPGRGAGTGVRGGLPGVGTLANEPVAGRLGTPGGAAGVRGAGGMGMAPMAGAKGQGDEDTEHNSPEYLKATHDSFWDDTDPVAPPVIGEDDD